MSRAVLGSLLCAALSLVACQGGPPPEPETPSSSEAPAPKKAAHLQLSPADMKEAELVALVPSPVEMQEALDRAGITTALAERVPERKISMDDPDKDQVAVRTGVALADLLLTARSAAPPQIGDRLLLVRSGLAALGASPDTLAVFSQLDAQVRNGALTGDELVRELDELSGSFLPRVEGELSDNALPLIRAGAWVEGAWLVSGAVIEKGSYERSGELLKHPDVVAHFRRYVSADRREQVTADVLAQLDTSLTTLGEVTAKEPFGEAETKAVHEATGAVLDLL
ncbi:MAG: hypothetical protein H6740_26095 [Alphaproteobacteria bacterium]|nr:hypothetical protein [Alphaproteobacteria bacterium]